MVVHAALALALGVLGLPSQAEAATIGSSVPVDRNLIGELIASITPGGPGTPSAVGLAFAYPSLDVRFSEVVLQIHAIETLVALSGEDIYLGANVFYTPMTGTLSGSWQAFAGIGGSIDFLTIPASEESSLAIGPVTPIGLRTGAEARFALYALPGLYVSIDDGELNLLGDGAIMASVWF